MLLLANPLGATSCQFGLLAARECQNDSATGNPALGYPGGAVLGLGGGAGPGVKSSGRRGAASGNDAGGGGDADEQARRPCLEYGYLGTATVRPWPPTIGPYVCVQGRPSFKVKVTGEWLLLVGVWQMH